MMKLFGLLAIFLFSTVSCVNIKSEEGLEFEEVDLASTGSSLSTFELTLYPILVTNCGGCHGVSQSPKFAVSDPHVSHNTLLDFNLVDLQNPSSSRIVQKVLSGHQGFTQELAAMIENAIADWSNAAPADTGNTGGGTGTDTGSGNGSGGGGSTDTTPKSESVKIYEATLFPYVKDNCSTCHGSYQNPMFAKNDSVDSHNALIDFKLVDLTDPANSRIVQKIKGGHNNFPSSLATEMEAAITSWKDQLGTDNIPDIPVLEATFTSIHKLILTPKCLGCHSPGGSRSREDYTDYSTTIKTGKIAPGDPSNSEMYKECVDGSMPFKADDLSTEELNVIRDWIQAGAKNN